MFLPITLPVMVPPSFVWCLAVPCHTPSPLPWSTQTKSAPNPNETSTNPQVYTRYIFLLAVVVCLPTYKASPLPSSLSKTRHSRASHGASPISAMFLYRTGGSVKAYRAKFLRLSDR